MSCCDHSTSINKLFWRVPGPLTGALTVYGVLLFHTIKFCLPGCAMGKWDYWQGAYFLDASVPISAEGALSCFTSSSPLQKSAFPRVFPQSHGPEFIPVSSQVESLSQSNVQTQQIVIIKLLFLPLHRITNCKNWQSACHFKVKKTSCFNIWILFCNL